MIKCRKEDQTNICGVYSGENNFQKTSSTSTLFEEKNKFVKARQLLVCKLA